MSHVILKPLHVPLIWLKVQDAEMAETPHVRIFESLIGEQTPERASQSTMNCGESKKKKKKNTDFCLLDSVGEGEGGMVWENGIEIRIISYME